MKTVCIVVGHKPTSGGAVNATMGLSEYDYNQPLAGMIADLLHRRNIRPVVLYRDSYTNLPADINRVDPDYCIELHCNSNADTSIKGTATLYWHTSVKGKALANRIQSAMVGLFGDNNRGIKPLTADSRGAHVVQKTAAPCVLLEPFFISNDESLAKGIALREQYANVVAGAITGFIKGELENES